MTRGNTGICNVASLASKPHFLPEPLPKPSANGTWPSKRGCACSLRLDCACLGCVRVGGGGGRGAGKLPPAFTTKSHAKPFCTPIAMGAESTELAEVLSDAFEHEPSAVSLSPLAGSPALGVGALHWALAPEGLPTAPNGTVERGGGARTLRCVEAGVSAVNKFFRSSLLKKSDHLRTSKTSGESGALMSSQMVSALDTLVNAKGGTMNVLSNAPDAEN